MAFFQDAPQLGNQFALDYFAQQYIARVLPAPVAQELVPEYRELGELASEYYAFSLRDRLHEPEHIMWDSWGARIDEIRVSPLWQQAQVLAAERGLVAAGYEKRFGRFDRVHQFLSNYFVQASLDFYSCPLAMTDGAAKTLLTSGNAELVDYAVTRLVSRDPKRAWTSGQWMTERTGGSDVSQTETIARKVDGEWKLWGTKWFTSATSADVALTLARTEGGASGSKGLALFFVELRDAQGRLRNIQVNRLKDKFGTRKVPTSELTLDGTPAILVSSTENGVRNIAPMLEITRTWNAIGAATGMRRALALAVDYAQRRQAFGKVLSEKPLHIDTLAGLAAEYRGAFLLAFRVVELLGASENGDAPATILLRALTPISKLTTGKQAVAIASEALECFGGAGYVEDTGLPVLLRDAQVLPIWEGTTNVLSLDLLRALAKIDTQEALVAEFSRIFATVKHARLLPAIEETKNVLHNAFEWLKKSAADSTAVEKDARRFALTVGRSLELALLAEHAQWQLSVSPNAQDGIAAVERFMQHGIQELFVTEDVHNRALLGLA